MESVFCTPGDTCWFTDRHVTQGSPLGDEDTQFWKLYWSGEVKHPLCSPPLLGFLQAKILHSF